ncbi:programmed cell death protein 2 [Zootermopsis nevadensis]|uniref:programmed cell death protein 2 n=1 Tax=Zootermopsis nevadensis TaxID=136037 RepID=UPI000B8EB28C|nr:programmed cell death protein 2 [Zootermopsis nevadensis]
MAENKKRTLSIELGYLEECAAWKLESRFFPSKVGGKPAWLDLCHLPNSILCGTEHEDKESEERRDVLVPQFEIVIEAEDCLQEEEVSNDLKTEEEKLKAFEKMVQEGKAGTLQGDTSFDELQKTTSPEDRQFSKFNSRIRRNPDQVLRYDRGGTPLWISSDHTPNEDDIPCCEYCGQHRRFEFQILPQLLNYLGLDSTEKSVDWGTLAIYTCSQSCNEGPAYKREFLWKQDIV